MLTSEHPLSRSQFRSEAGQRFCLDGKTYELGGLLGDGAAGIVRKATRLSDNTVLAIKFIAPDPKYIEQDRFDDVAARFKREGERGARLDHQSLVRVHAYCDNGGSLFSEGYPTNPFILMEFLGGKTLESYIRHQPASGTFSVTDKRLKIAAQMATAVEYLHKRRLIHRDVKPANVFLVKGLDDLKLGDFGVVKWGDFHASLATGTLTATAQTGLGTQKYMAPEQAISPKEVSAKADIYSLGVTLFELFTSQILLSSHHVYQTMFARLQRGTTYSRCLDLGYKIESQDVDVAETIFDMHLRGATGRPSIEKVRARLEWELERRSQQ